jgi:hypothetical protein
MKEPAGKINALPSKRLFLSIISDYDLQKSICELIDNAFDNWVVNGRKKELTIKLDLNVDQQTISIEDNAGGLPKQNLKYIIGPGQTSNLPTEKIIGIFGVGTKRAVVALAQDVKIFTRYKKEPTYMVEFDDSWLEDEEWELESYKVDNLCESSTYILLQRLRNKINDEKIKYLKKHLSKTYARFLSNKKVKLIVNKEKLEPKEFTNWAYPPDHLPQELNGYISANDNKKVKVSILAGLTTESSPAGQYGVYFYCNDRLIASHLKNFQVGFARGLAGLPHPSVSLMRVVVSLEGEAQLMPWNSSKSALSYDHHIFKALQPTLIQIVKHYTSLSRALEGLWSDQVFKFKSGKPKVRNDIDFAKIKKINLPPIPKSRPSFEDKIKKFNKKIESDKPWTKGIVGGIIAADVISKKKFDEKNRFALIVLDSTLEIAFKEFLVNDSNNNYSDSDLKRIFSKRYLVETEIKKYVSIDPRLWKKVKYYYNLRCKLIHERASVGISDSDINDYTKVVQTILKKLFNLKF